MNDLKARLFKYGDIASRGKDHPQNVACREALERIEELEAALKPFADAPVGDHEPDERHYSFMEWNGTDAVYTIQIGDLRHAASLLEPKT